MQLGMAVLSLILRLIQSLLKTVGKLYEGQQYGIALKNGSEWVDDVNEALASIKEDGTYKKIYEKWFGPMPEDM